MDSYKFGKWIVNETGIVHAKIEDAVILKEDLLRIKPGTKDLLESLLYWPSKTWMNQRSTYELNTAFFFAMNYFKLALPQETSIVNTLLAQKEEIRNQ